MHNKVNCVKYCETERVLITIQTIAITIVHWFHTFTNTLIIHQNETFF